MAVSVIPQSIHEAAGRGVDRFRRSGTSSPVPLDLTRLDSTKLRQELRRQIAMAYFGNLAAGLSFDQISVCSEISKASSTSMPRYLTVDSSLEWPSSNCTARRFLVRR